MTMPEKIYAYKDKQLIGDNLYRTNHEWRERNQNNDEDMIAYIRHDLYEALEYEVKILKDLVNEKDDEIEALEAENKRLAEALNRIASWPEGFDVTMAFDEPRAARIAREALAQRIGGKQ